MGFVVSKRFFSCFSLIKSMGAFDPWEVITKHCHIQNIQALALVVLMMPPVLANSDPRGMVGRVYKGNY